MQQDITDARRRLEAALDRISAAVETLGPAPGRQGEDPAALSEALEAERRLTGELQERLAADAEAYRARVTDLERDCDAMRAQIAALEEDRDRLRAAADTLRGTCESLRRDTADGAAGPDGVNAAMVAEIEALTAARASDRAEIETIIALLSEERGEERAHG